MGLNGSPNGAFFADAVIPSVAHEQFETITNPLPMGFGFSNSGIRFQSNIAWDQSKIGCVITCSLPDPTSLKGAFLGEVGDLCKPSATADGPDSSVLEGVGPDFANVLLNGHKYLVYDIWSNSAGGCRLVPSTRITGAPGDAILAGSTVSFGTDTSGGTGSFSYSWTKNGAPFSASSSITDTPGLGTTIYAVTVTDSIGAVSNTASVQINVFDFTVSPSPADSTVLRSSSASYLVTLQLVSGSSTIGLDPIALSSLGLPADAAPKFASGSITPSFAGASTTLTISTAGPMVGSLGDFPFTITGSVTSGGSRSGSSNLHIYDYIITASPTPLLVLNTGSNQYSISIAPISGSTSTGLPAITLKVGGLPGATTGVFTPVTGSASGFNSALTISTTGARPGTYTFTLTGTDTRSPEGGQRGTTTQLVVLTPQQAAQLLSNQVSSFQSNGILNHGQAGSLQAKLNHAIGNLNTGDNTAACNQLTALVNQISADVASGTLTKAEADLLLSGPLGIYAIMAAIPC